MSSRSSSGASSIWQSCTPNRRPPGLSTSGGGDGSRVLASISNVVHGHKEDISELQLRQSCLEDKLDEQSQENEQLRHELEFAKEEIRRLAQGQFGTGRGGNGGMKRQRIPRYLTVSIPN